MTSSRSNFLPALALLVVIAVAVGIIFSLDRRPASPATTDDSATSVSAESTLVSTATSLALTLNASPEATVTQEVVATLEATATQEAAATQAATAPGEVVATQEMTPTFTQPPPTFTILPPTATPSPSPSLPPATLIPPTRTSIFTQTPLPMPEPEPVFPAALAQIVLAAPPDTPLVGAGLVIAQDRIQARLDALGIIEYFTTIKDDGTLLVEIPNTDELDSVIATLQRRGYIEFIDFSGVESIDGWEDVQVYTTSQGSDPSGAVHPVSAEPFPIVLSGRIFESVTPRLDEMINTWVLDFVLINQLAGTFQAFTEAHIGQPLAIAVDGVVLSVPVIQAPIEGGAGVITGNFTEGEVRALASELASGPLPFALDVTGITLLGP